MGKIQILNVIDTGYSTAVEYIFHFDDGSVFEGRMNFALDVTEEQIIQTLIRKLRRMQRAKQRQSKLSREALRASLKGRIIDVE